MEYIFILGRTHRLCQAELEAVLISHNVSYNLLFNSQEVFHIKTIKTEKRLDVNYLINLCGGTVKITEVIGKLKKPFYEEKFFKIIIGEIKKEKKDFGLSFYGERFNINGLIRLEKEIKKILKEKGLKLSYVLPNEGLVLSSVVVNKKKLIEINIVEEKEEFILAKTLVVQDFEGWNQRDYGRPYVEPQKGMLPPKVARMMINLTRANKRWQTENTATIFDPFCGVGTILAEGLMVGYNVIGSDIDKESVEKTEKNLKWLTEKFSVAGSKFSVFISDATHVSEKVEKESIDAIVTEPYLGPLIETQGLELKTKGKKKITPKYLKNIITGLEKLYIGCLKDWWRVLKPAGVIVIIFPSYKISVTQPLYQRQPNDFQQFVKKPIDICEKLGYNVIGGPYKYSRPQAVVERNIYVLRKIKNKK